MIRALSPLRRGLGLPEVPTLTGNSRAARRLRRAWRATVHESIVSDRMARHAFATMERYRNIMAGPDDISAPEAEGAGRIARMANAVLIGFLVTP